MARKAYKSALGLAAVAKFGEGFMQGMKERRELERLAAERELKKQQDEAAKGHRDRQHQLEVDKFEFEKSKTPAPKPAKPKELNIPMTKFRENPAAYEKAPEGYTYKFREDTTKKSVAPTPQQAASLYTFKELSKVALTRPLNEYEAQRLTEASQNLDLNIVPEEDKGMLYSIMQRLPGAEKQFNITAAQPGNPGVPAPIPAMPGKTTPAAPTQVQTIRVKHKATGQTGTIPANEFDPNLYQRI